MRFRWVLLFYQSFRFNLTNFGLQTSSDAHSSQLTDLHIISLNLDVPTDQAIHCVKQHSSFSTDSLCLHREVPQTAIVGLNQARGLRALRAYKFSNLNVLI